MSDEKTCCSETLERQAMQGLKVQPGKSKGEIAWELNMKNSGRDKELED